LLIYDLKAELELAQLEKELMPVERYAVTFVELQMAPLSVDELQRADEEVDIAKEEWELNHLKAMKVCTYVVDSEKGV